MGPGSKVKSENHVRPGYKPGPGNNVRPEKKVGPKNKVGPGNNVEIPEPSVARIDPSRQVGIDEPILAP